MYTLGMVEIFPAIFPKIAPPPSRSTVCTTARSPSRTTSERNERSVSAAKDESSPRDIPKEITRATAFLNRMLRTFDILLSLLI